MSQVALKKETPLPTITVERVPTLAGDGVLVLRKPLVFQPTRTADGEFYRVEYEPLQVISMRYEYEELEPAILEIIAFMWDSYVNTPEEKLAPDALAQKQIVLAHFV